MSIIDILRRPPGELNEAERDGVAALLALVADEFVPPLTTRSGTTEQSLKENSARGPDDYLNGILAQDNFLALMQGEVVGFLSFRKDYREPRFAGVGHCVYVSTIAVSPQGRGNGYARRLYEALFQSPEAQRSWVVLRTWSTNEGHLKLLDALGFQVLLKLPSDRPGNIDTLYLGRAPASA